MSAQRTFYCSGCDSYDDVAAGEEPERTECDCGGARFELHPGLDSTFYVAAYSTWQSYGGPEEGGWYFCSGELQAAIPVPATSVRGYEEGGVTVVRWHVDRAAEATARQLIERALGEARPYGTSASAAHRDDGLSIRVAPGFPAMHFPERRPHYE